MNIFQPTVITAIAHYDCKMSNCSIWNSLQAQDVFSLPSPAISLTIMIFH